MLTNNSSFISVGFSPRFTKAAKLFNLTARFQSTKYGKLIRKNNLEKCVVESKF